MWQRIITPIPVHGKQKNNDPVHSLSLHGGTDQPKPKPSLASWMARSRRSSNCSFEVYSGKSNWLKLQIHCTFRTIAKINAKVKSSKWTYQYITMYEQMEADLELRKPYESEISGDQKYLVVLWNLPMVPAEINSKRGYWSSTAIYCSRLWKILCETTISQVPFDLWCSSNKLQ